MVKGVTFRVHVDRGDVTGKCWDGEFEGKEVLSFADQIAIERNKRTLLGPGPYEGMDPEAFAQAIVLSRLQVYLVKSPEWWGDGTGHADNNLLQAVYDQARKIISDHDAKILKAGEDAKKNLAE